MPLGQKQSVESLNFILYSRPLHPELFDIYHQHRIVQPQFEALVWVTGCAHLVTFSALGDTISEVMAEQEDMLPERGLAARYRFRGEKQHEHQSPSGVRYMMNFQVESMGEKLYDQTHRDLARSGAKHGLFVPLPEWRSGPLTPFTYIDYQVRPDGLHLFAFHAFPDALTIIKTQSIFDMPSRT
jgi:hypothetical protein